MEVITYPVSEKGPRYTAGYTFPTNTSDGGQHYVSDGLTSIGYWQGYVPGPLIS